MCPAFFIVLWQGAPVHSRHDEERRMAKHVFHRPAAGLGLALILGLAGGPVAAADFLSGEWTGSYSCYQGATALTLSIEPEGEQWRGTFTFGPLKANKGVPHGAYSLSITRNGEHYDMQPGAWIEQPDGYVTVALDGTMSADLTTLSGAVLFDGCDSFEVTRTSPLPAPPPRKTKVGG
jgi:hypothetical protein